MAEQEYRCGLPVVAQLAAGAASVVALAVAVAAVALARGWLS